MFWKKKQDQRAVEPVMAAEPIRSSKTKQEELEDAAKKLSASLRSYSEASYAAQQPAPDEALNAAHRKVSIARKIITEGRIGYALGRCLPEHMAHWHAWSQRDDFMTWVGFEASNISSSLIREEDSGRRVEVTTNDFVFRDRQYRLIFRDEGVSPAPGDPVYTGEVHFFAGDICVAKFDVTKDLMKDYSEWQFSDVTGFRVGPWLQDVLDIAAQIESYRGRSTRNFVDDRARKAADEIDLG
ncbi:hypothetical protein G6L68_25090 [Agrobacterium fabrum]|uniref:hypothetical protein n=1 Tax=Agrobacterium fabrum TaxID=1176649 RepID=UPI000EF60635|nr:hypothetical protein [Agrobacterium fabrum]AYM66162.1 hypothetical protein At12D13_50100 [Agrobacterium fabrum]NTE63909.1 hypothetical protein [Agrobacterium fabrum]